MAKIKLNLESSNFENGQVIPTQYTADGTDQPPDLKWTHEPEGTRSYVMIIDDPDAPHGTFTHWVRYDIPKHFFHLYALDVDSLGLPPGAKRGEVEEAMKGHVLDEATLMGAYERT